MISKGKFAGIAGCILTLSLESSFAFSSPVGMSMDSPRDIVSPNYFITGFGTHQLDYDAPLLLNKNNQVKFRIHVNFRLAGWEESGSGLYLGYTQLSFWNIFDIGSPFFDNNYQPELFFHYAPQEESSPWYVPSARFGLAHESNGLSGEAGRGWDRVIAGLDVGRGPLTGISVGASIWYVFEKARVLEQCLGNGELRLSYRLPDILPGFRLGIGTASRIVFQDLHFANIELNLFVNPFGNPKGTLRWLPSFMVQYFTGTGETLRECFEHTSSLRLGIAFLR